MEHRKEITYDLDVRIDFENQHSEKITFKNVREARVDDKDEVVGRMRDEKQEENRQEEQDRLTYLRLKARFEPGK